MSTNALATPPNDNLLVIRNCFMLLVGNNLLAAACLNQISYWNMKMGRDIWKTDDEFSEELHMSIHQFRRMKSKYPPRLAVFENHSQRHTRNLSL